MALWRACRSAGDRVMRGASAQVDYEEIGRHKDSDDEYAGNRYDEANGCAQGNLQSNLLGGKTLGSFSSIVIVVNNIAGPGMLVLPRVYKEAGWVLPSLVLALICVGSGLAAVFLVDTMARVPENGRFQRRIEFVNIFEEFWGPKGMYIAQVGFIMNMMAQICSSIVSNAQVMDSFIVFLSPYSATYALQLSPRVEFLTWSPPKAMLTIQPSLSMQDVSNCHNLNVVPFRLEDGVVEDRVLISLGYVVLALVLVPLSLMNLDENMLIQKISFYMMIFLSGEFLYQFYVEGISYSIPAFGDNYSHVMGSIVFNYAFIAVIPSWINEKRPDVSVRNTGERARATRACLGRRREADARGRAGEGGEGQGWASCGRCV
jgi:hypothetical protein